MDTSFRPCLGYAAIRIKITADIVVADLYPKIPFLHFTFFLYLFCCRAVDVGALGGCFYGRPSFEVFNLTFFALCLPGIHLSVMTG